MSTFVNQHQLARYMQPTKSYVNHLQAKVDGYERADDFPDDIKNPNVENRRHSISRGNTYWNPSPSAQSRAPKYLQDHPVYGSSAAQSPLAKKARDSLLLSNGDFYQDRDEEDLQLKKLLTMYTDVKYERDEQRKRIAELQEQLSGALSENEMLKGKVKNYEVEIESLYEAKKLAALLPSVVEAGERGEKERTQLQAAIEMYQNLETNHEKTVQDAVNIAVPTIEQIATVCPTLHHESLGMQRLLNSSASPITAIASIFKRSSALLTDEVYLLREKLNRLEIQDGGRRAVLETPAFLGTPSSSSMPYHQMAAQNSPDMSRISSIPASPVAPMENHRKQIRYTARNPANGEPMIYETDTMRERMMQNIREQKYAPNRWMMMK
jgi:hypothetical protein|eukprot:g1933.t1